VYFRLDSGANKSRKTREHSVRRDSGLFCPLLDEQDGLFVWILQVVPYPALEQDAEETIWTMRKTVLIGRR